MTDFEQKIQKLIAQMKERAPSLALKGLAWIQAPSARTAPDVVVVARFSPGFSDDLSSWRLTFDLAGILVQEIKVWRSDDCSANGRKREVVEVAPAFVESILQRADELDFWNLNAENPNVSVTDLPSLELSIRSGDRARSYAPESVTWHACEGLQGAEHFMELWNLIHRHAPFPPKD